MCAVCSWLAEGMFSGVEKSRTHVAVSELVDQTADGKKQALVKREQIGGTLVMPGGLVGARFGAQADSEAVPAIDRDKGKGQIDQFRLVKRLAYLLVQLIRYVVVGNESYSLRPGQGCAFPFGVIG